MFIAYLLVRVITVFDDHDNLGSEVGQDNGLLRLEVERETRNVNIPQ